MSKKNPIRNKISAFLQGKELEPENKAQLIVKMYGVDKPDKIYYEDRLKILVYNEEEYIEASEYLSNKDFRYLGNLILDFQDLFL